MARFYTFVAINAGLIVTAISAMVDIYFKGDKNDPKDENEQNKKKKAYCS